MCPEKGCNLQSVTVMTPSRVYEKENIEKWSANPWNRTGNCRYRQQQRITGHVVKIMVVKNFCSCRMRPRKGTDKGMFKWGILRDATDINDHVAILLRIRLVAASWEGRVRSAKSCLLSTWCDLLLWVIQKWFIMHFFMLYYYRIALSL